MSPEVVLLAILIYVIVGAVSIWILYTIIWRAVRRGLREFHRRDTAPR